MIDKHEEAAREAAADGAQVMCFQELFYGPYFCQVQDAAVLRLHRGDPRRPDDAALPERSPRSSAWCCVLPMYEIVQAGVYYNTAAVIDADGTYLGKYRKQHIPQVKGFWEKYYFKPGNGGYPVFDTAVGKVGVYICYDRHFPEELAGARPQRRRDRVQPVGHQPRPVRVHLAARAAGGRGGQHVLRRRDQPGRHRGRLGDDDFYGQSYFVDPEGKFVGDVGDAYKPELIVRDLDLDKIKRGPRPLGLLPRPPPRRLRGPGGRVTQGS